MDFCTANICKVKFHSAGLYSIDFQQLSVAIVTVRAEILNCMRNVCIFTIPLHTYYVFKTKWLSRKLSSQGVLRECRKGKREKASIKKMQIKFISCISVCYITALQKQKPSKTFVHCICYMCFDHIFRVYFVMTGYCFIFYIYSCYTFTYVL